jgi:hypothetical protein
MYAGYSHIQKAHGDYQPGVEAEGNYPIDIGININNSAEYSMEWVGARYQVMTNWNLSAAYYHISQNSWTIGLGPTGNQGLGCSRCGPALRRRLQRVLGSGGLRLQQAL